MGKAQLEELNKHGRYLSVPHGVSMWPMILNKEGIVEIEKLERPARRYDLVLYIRGEEQGVIHRVLRVREKDYIIAGDNCWRREYIPKDRVVGIAVRFYRKGKWYEVTDWRYRIYVHLWTDLFFIRMPLLFLRDKTKAVLRKIAHAKT
ncbi:MAG: S24/S26 family peptidase [Oscillospiraceae bacterium]|nr:S24/S26 family peptidase [Oscillospiraceae bacterium]